MEQFSNYMDKLPDVLTREDQDPGADPAEGLHLLLQGGDLAWDKTGFFLWESVDQGEA